MTGSKKMLLRWPQVICAAWSKRVPTRLMKADMRCYGDEKEHGDRAALKPWSE